MASAKCLYKVTLRLLLVRHGQSSFNKESRIQGRSDCSILTPNGHEQATKTGEALREIKLDAIYSSPLKRAAATTERILGASNCLLSPIFDDDLLEIDLTPWSGMTVEEAKAKFPQDYKTWRQSPEDLTFTKDSESFKPLSALMNQAADFINKLVKVHPLEKNQTVLVVGHNAILRCLIIELLGRPEHTFRKLRLENASLCVLNLIPSNKEPYKVQIECLNSTAHLSKTLPSQGVARRIILVRHGETNWNREGRFQGQIDIPLNTNGLVQASAARDFLKDVKIGKAFSSSMKRPTQTANKILESHSQINLELKNGLVEIGHGLWEGKLEKEIHQEWPELLDKWKDSPEKVQMPEGETIQDVWERSVESFESISTNLPSEGTALVVAHDAVNKTIICHLLGLKHADIWMIKQGNGGVTLIDIPQDSSQPMVITCLNLTSHLGGLLDCTAAGAL